MPLEGLRVLSLESRRAKEMESLVTREGGAAFIAPSVKERALEDDDTALRFVERLEAGEFDMVICMTAVGLTLLRDMVSPRMPLERLAEALRRVTIVSRGPKPVGVLKALGVPIHLMIPEPNTWREIVDAVSGRPERRIAVQEYGRPNLEMNRSLQALGAAVSAIALYRWELPDDLGPLQDAARRLAAREFDVVLFTSSIQLDHLLEVARGLELETEVRDALSADIVIASIGPVMTDALAGQGLQPDIVPKHPKMWSLVRAAADEAPRVLAAKRSAPTPA
jgi:uroporphyrinogen-III synthase